MNESIRASAMQWWLQVNEAPADERLQQRFEAWLAVDDSHRLAYLDVLLVTNAAGVATEDPDADARPHRTLFKPGRTAGWIAMTFALVMCCLLPYAPRWFEQWRADVVAPPGLARVVTLEDGSHIELAADTAIAVAMRTDARTIELLRGRVTIDVARDARPFALLWKNTTVHDIGTRFTVEAAEDAVRVGVRVGTVEVRREGEQATPIAAGESRLWTAQGSEAVAWPEQASAPGLLVFNHQPAALAFAQWASVRGKRVIWLDAPPAEARLDAVLPVRSPAEHEAALASLARHFRIDVVFDTAGVVLLRPTH